MLEARLQKHIDLFIERYPALESCVDDIEKAYLIIEERYKNDKKLLIAGNG
jgi:D-sedoheptulose 7-phosphate isomerase